MVYHTCLLLFPQPLPLLLLLGNSTCQSDGCVAMEKKIPDDISDDLQNKHSTA